MKSQVLRTVLSNISGEAAGETLGSERVKLCLIIYFIFLGLSVVKWAGAQREN